MRRTGRRAGRYPHLLVAALLITGCGTASAGQARALPGAGGLTVQPQNGRLLVGVNRISVALFQTARMVPVGNASVTVGIATREGGGARQTRPLQYIGPAYGNIPVYVGTARFPTAGSYTYTVRATLTTGTTETASADVAVTTRSPELPVGFAVPAGVAQRVVGDVHGDVAAIDSGVPPDPFHDHTIAEGPAAHHPMVVYFGQPGHCVSATCGPTVSVLEGFAKTYGDRLWIEHVEVHDPADSQALNPAYLRFGLSSEPWIYFINAQGIASDRFEGPVTEAELAGAAEGTLAGRVPAVDISGG